jgi:hypothetical protein
LTKWQAGKATQRLDRVKENDEERSLLVPALLSLSLAASGDNIDV